MIDAGRAAVAAAEEVAFGGTSFDELLSRDAAAECVRSLVGRPWWKSCGPSIALATPRRDARSSSARPCGDGVEVRLTDEQLTAATVAHELAHALAGVDRGHDACFRTAHVDVVAVLAGSSSAAALVDAYRAMSLDVAPRDWPAPYRAVGDTFVLTTGVRSPGSHR